MHRKMVTTILRQYLTRSRFKVKNIFIIESGEFR